LCEDKGAFFQSVLGSLNHILVGDIIWLNRFANHPSSYKTLSYISQLNQPKSLDDILYKNLDALKSEREKIDEIIIKWVNLLSDQEMNECISYTNMAGNTHSKPLSSLILHLFLHQVHHRGQITTLLTQSGIDFGDTDLIEIINECNP
jgi:uncharacterized damage-inducible protein DinB